MASGASEDLGRVVLTIKEFTSCTRISGGLCWCYVCVRVRVRLGLGWVWVGVMLGVKRRKCV